MAGKAIALRVLFAKHVNCGGLLPKGSLGGVAPNKVKHLAGPQ
jgi:hypothetical protein